MFAAALIVFREFLEASLIITIIVAATRGVPHRSFWIALGVMGGVAGAGIIATLTQGISAAFEGAGQEIVSACILFVAVLMIGWHVVWMNSHGRKMASDIKAVGQRVAEGEKHMSVLAVVVGLAVMREGSEVVLMLQGLWMSSPSPWPMIGGAALGLSAGVLASLLMYVGFLALPIGRIFATTNILLVLIAAGMSARAANFLTQAGLVSSFGSRLWDTSAVLSDQSIVGQALSALVGYIASPSGIEVFFYALTVTLILVLMHLADCRKNAALALAKG